MNSTSGLSFLSHIQYDSFRGKYKLSDFNSPSHFIVSIVWATKPIFLQPGIENLQSSHSACPAFFAGFLARSSGTSLYPPATRLQHGMAKGRIVCPFRRTPAPTQKSTVSLPATGLPAPTFWGFGDPWSYQGQLRILDPPIRIFFDTRFE